MILPPREKMLTKQQLLRLLSRGDYQPIYDECIRHGEVVYDAKRMIRHSEYHFVGVVHFNDYWLFEFKDGDLSLVNYLEN